MRSFKTAVALFSFLAVLPGLGRADDFGPRGDIGSVRSDARRLLAQRVRATGIDPKAIAISDIVVVKDQALLSWDSGKQHGVMGLVRYLDRWWDALDATRTPQGWRSVITFPLGNEGLSKELIAAAAVHNADARSLPASPKNPITASQEASPLMPNGGTVHLDRIDTVGYDMSIAYSANDAAPGSKFTRVYGRAPTSGEIISNPAPPRGFGGASDVFYFDLAIGGTKEATFTPGTKVDIWVPFVLEDTLSYRVSFVMDGKFSKSIHGTIFDNVLHFELPPFSIAPPNELQAEVEGFW